MGPNLGLHELSALERLRLPEPLPRPRPLSPSRDRSGGSVGLEAAADGRGDWLPPHQWEPGSPGRASRRATRLPEPPAALLAVAALDGEAPWAGEGPVQEVAATWQSRRRVPEVLSSDELFGAATSSKPAPRGPLGLPDLPSPHVTITVPPVQMQDSDFLSSCKVFCCGAVAGAVSRTATAPLDRLRTVLVLQAASYSSSPQRSSMLTELRRIHAAGGWRAFYQGNGTNLLKIAPESAVRFMVFEYLRDHLSLRRATDAAPNPSSSTLERFVAGSMAGMTAQLVIYPLEVIKTRLAAASPGYFRGIQDCGLQAVRQGGVMALYRGLGTSLVGMIPYAGVDLCVYTTLRDRLPSDASPNPLLLGACGTVSSVVAQICSFPLGLVRNRLQAQGMAPDRPVLYAGLRDCLRKTYRSAGLRGLYDGLLPTLLKVVPATSLSYIVYERCKVLMDVKPHK